MFIILVLTPFLTSCVSKEETVQFDSFLVGNSELVDELKLNDALFAFEWWILDDVNHQFIYIWDNQLRRDLYDEITDMLLNMDVDRKHVDTYQVLQLEDSLTLDLLMNGDVIHTFGFSELTRSVMLSLFPSTFNINSADFYQQLVLMAIRLETLEMLGDTEVICLKTETKLELTLSDYEQDVVHHVYDVDTLMTITT
jgi:hypothetical protein